MRLIFALIFVVSGLVAVTYSLRYEDVLPNLHRCNCRYYEENCLAEAIKSFMSNVRNGVPELGIPIFRPYRPERDYKLHLRDFTETLLLTDIILTGVDDYKISNVRVLERLPNMDFVAHFPSIHLFSIAYTKTPLLTSPLNSSNCDLINHVFKNITIKVNVRGYEIEYSIKEGKKTSYYLTHLDLIIKDVPNIKDHTDYFKLYDYKTTAQSTTNPSMKRPVKYIVEDEMSEVLRRIMNNMFAKLPVETLCLL